MISRFFILFLTCSLPMNAFPSYELSAKDHDNEDEVSKQAQVQTSCFSNPFTYLAGIASGLVFAKAYSVYNHQDIAPELDKIDEANIAEDDLEDTVETDPTKLTPKKKIQQKKHRKKKDRSPFEGAIHSNNGGSNDINMVRGNNLFSLLDENYKNQIQVQEKKVVKKTIKEKTNSNEKEVIKSSTYTRTTTIQPMQIKKKPIVKTCMISKAARHESASEKKAILNNVKKVATEGNLILDEIVKKADQDHNFPQISFIIFADGNRYEIEILSQDANTTILNQYFLHNDWGRLVRAGVRRVVIDWN